MENKLHAGFLGGCINSPKYVNCDNTYFCLLKKSLPDIEIYLGKYLAYSELIEVSKRYIENESIDILFVFLRTFPYYVLNKPFIKLPGINNKPYYKIHPYLLKRHLKIWPPELDKYLALNENNPVPKRSYLGLRDMNSIFGKVLGLHKWSYLYVLNTLLELNNLCKYRNVKLIIIGPTKNPETFMGDKICAYLNRKISEQISKYQIDYIDINVYSDKNNNSIFQKDKFHFNELGHCYLFKKIYNKIMQEYGVKK